MIRHIKRYFAIRSYLRRLSGDLVRRFGRRALYKIEHVTQAVQRGKFSAAFIAHAHAIFCSREDFDAHYGPLGVACTYDGLRKPIARRYFSGRMDFDAETVIARFGSAGYSRGDFSESGIGSNYNGH
jgi:hypothetical protein